MAQRDHRFKSLLDALRKQIDSSFVPGESLPSERDWAPMHGVAPNTLHRALKTLTEEGYVEARTRVGWVKAKPSTSSMAGSAKKENAGAASFKVGLMTRRSADEWPKLEIYNALLEEARRRGIRVVEIPNRHFLRTTLERNRIELARVPWNTFDVGLLVEAEETIRTRDPRLLAHRVLSVDQDATAYGIDSVAFADAQAGALAARHLLELGHTRFAVTDEVNDPGYPLDPATLLRRHGFEAAVGEAGGLLLPQWRMPVPCRGLPGWNPNSKYFCGTHRQTVKATVAAWSKVPPGLRPTALLALTHAPLSHGKLLEELGQHGWRVPRDLSVLTITSSGKLWGGEEPEFGGLRFSSLDFDLQALVRRVYDAAADLAMEPEKMPAHAPGSPPRTARLHLAPAMLALGGTLAPPPR